MLRKSSTHIDDIAVGDSASCRWQIGAAQVDEFARLSQDDNPLHMDDAFARECGFSGRVAHGMLALSAISRLIGTELPGPGSLWMSQELHFVAPVLVGDTLEARVTVQSVSRGAAVVVLTTEALNVATQAAVLRGVAKVRLTPRISP